MLCLGVLNKMGALNLKSKLLLNHKHFAYSFLKSIRCCAGIILPFLWFHYRCKHTKYFV